MAPKDGIGIYGRIGLMTLVLVIMSLSPPGVRAAPTSATRSRREFTNVLDNFSPGFRNRYLNRVQQGHIGKPKSPDDSMKDNIKDNLDDLPKFTTRTFTRDDFVTTTRAPATSGSSAGNDAAESYKFEYRFDLSQGSPTGQQQQQQSETADPIYKDLDPSLASELNSIADKLRAGHHEEVLEDSQKLLNVVEPMLTDTNKPEGASILVSLWTQRMRALSSLNRRVEALIEAQKIRDLANKFAGLDILQSQQLRRSIELDIERAGPMALLGAQSRDEAKQAHKRLILLLHPDKNAQLSPEAREYLQTLFVKVRDAYKSVSSGI